MNLRAPLLFRPVYQRLVWGGRRLADLRADLPIGPVGESWELADHSRGMSVVCDGPLAGHTLRELVDLSGRDLVGLGFSGGQFPIMVKILDATEKLSVQVHPDDEIARRLGLGPNGKSECWFILKSGGALYQGTRQGVDRATFERALVNGAVADLLNRFESTAGDVFFLQARTVHALGAGCFLYEVQQTSDVTFRVYDWNRLGLDGKPRPLHVAESLATIDFARDGFGPHQPAWHSPSGGVETRPLAECPYFVLHQYRVAAGASLHFPSMAACAVVTCVGGGGLLTTEEGGASLSSIQTALVPAAAERWQVRAASDGLEILVATPRL
jgi:mannose-6-phosphate isomerase